MDTAFDNIRLGGTGYILKFGGDDKWLDGKMVFLPKKNEAPVIFL